MKYDLDGDVIVVMYSYGYAILCQRRQDSFEMSCLRVRKPPNRNTFRAILATDFRKFADFSGARLYYIIIS